MAMLNKTNKQFQKIISVFFTAMYVFVVLFSSELHNHKGESFYKDSGSKKTEKSITKELSSNQSGDCLACHFLATGNTLVPEQFTFHFENQTQETEQIISAQEKVWEQTKSTIQLRGPPALS